MNCKRGVVADGIRFLVTGLGLSGFGLYLCDLLYFLAVFVK